MTLPEHLAAAGSAVDFRFFASCDLNLQVQLRVDRLLGCLPAYREAQLGSSQRGDGTLRLSAVYVEGRLCSYGEDLGIPCRTPWADASTAGAAWDAWLAFPMKYRDLGHDAQLALTVWEVREGGPRRVLGGSTLPLFSKKGRLKTGPQDLQLWLGRAADWGWPTTTPGKVPMAQRGELGRVEQVVKRYERGEVEHVEWLDRLALKAVADLRHQEQQRRVQEAEAAAATGMSSGGGGGGGEADGTAAAAGDAAGDAAAGLAAAAAPVGQQLRLVLELPGFPQAVIYQQASVAGHTTGAAAAAGGLGASAATADAISTPLPGTSGAAAAGAGFAPGGVGPGSGGSSSLILLHDAEVGRENPAEAKAAKLARSLTRGLVDKRLKPDTEERRRIEAVLDYPPNRPLSADDKAVLWRFRYALTPLPRALTKFLKCVDWSDASEARQAAELMQQWAPVGVADALELLSPDFANEEVRGHAVEVLQGTDDEELLYYLLQLVQALRYESCDDSRLAAFLVSRARRSITLASFLFWYLLAELGDDAFGPRASTVQSAIIGATGQHASPTEECIHQQVQLMARLKHMSETVSGMRGAAAKKTEALRGLLSPGGVHGDLAAFACPCPLDPSVHLLGLVPSECSVFKSAMSPLRLTFRARLPGGSSMLAPGSGGGDGGSGGGSGHEVGGRMATLTLASHHSLPSPDGSRHASHPSSRRHSLQQDTAAAAAPQQQQQQQQQQPGPSLGVSAAAVGEAGAAAAAAAAAVAVAGGSPPHLHSPGASSSGGGGGEAGVRRELSGAGSLEAPATALATLIYKRGDDLRQDQLVVQMISLMDRLLKREHLDLKITPYQVLATSCTDGLIEFVPSQSLARVLADNRSIHRFLALHHPDPSGPFGLSGEVLSTFVKSCAGYCVMTYVLGVGDRHLDNLMLTPEGRLFHIDFGYILGRDPKPFPPPMKLCKEMVDAMGGQDSEHYRQFKTYCCEAYNILRKSANLLLNLFHLMAGASIPDIQSDPEKAMLKLQEKLRPELRDEEAALWMTQVLSDSATALMPQVIEKAHQWAQYWR